MHATDSLAFWELVDGSQCVFNTNGVGTGTSVLGNTLTLVGLPTGTGGGQIANIWCPFVDSNTTPDTSITGASLDFCATGTALAAGTVSSQVCAYSNWTLSCQALTPNTALAAGACGGIFNNVTAWVNDSSHGYGFVNAAVANGLRVNIQGVHYF
jgi:hypothetical protein